MKNKKSNESMNEFKLLKIDLPPALTKDEENKLIRSIQTKEARDELIERNIRLVIHIAKAFNNSYAELEEIISIGTIGLIKGVNSFNPNRGTKFSVYCSKCISNEIISHRKKYTKKTLEIPITKPIGYDKHGKALLVENVLYHNNNEINFTLTKMCVLSFFKTLNEREQKIFKLKYVRGLTQTQISSELNISQSRISKIQNNMLTNFKEYIA